jgi:TetR/AcrR family tetracycline transcriptional repressor
MLLAYRDGSRVFSGTYVTDDSVLASMEVPLRKLVDAGFSLRISARGWATLYNFVVGFTIEEQAVHPMRGEHDPRYALERRAARIDAAR